MDRKYLKNVQKNQFSKVKNRLLELEKDFVELKDRQVTIKREKEGRFFKTIIVSVDVIDKSEQKGQLKTLGTITQLIIFLSLYEKVQMLSKINL